MPDQKRRLPGLRAFLLLCCPLLLMSGDAGALSMAPLCSAAMKPSNAFYSMLRTQIFNFLAGQLPGGIGDAAKIKVTDAAAEAAKEVTNGSTWGCRLEFTHGEKGAIGAVKCSGGFLVVMNTRASLWSKATLDAVASGKLPEGVTINAPEKKFSCEAYR